MTTEPIFQQGFRAYGVDFKLQAESLERLEELCRYAPVGSLRLPTSSEHELFFEVRPAGRGFTVYEGGTRRKAAFKKREAALKALTKRIELSLGTFSQHFTFIHAGVVKWGELGWLIPGESQAGKSTLVNEMLKLGATYYSDEYALLDLHGLVHPYPRKLRLRTEETPSAGSIGRKPLKIERILFTKYLAGSRFEPKTLEPSFALVEIMKNCIQARCEPKKTMENLSSLANEAKCLKGVRGDATETVELLRQFA
jgi:hypothetical protein